MVLMALTFILAQVAAEPRPPQPLTRPELMTALRGVPGDTADRLARLQELLLAAGADEADIHLDPIPSPMRKPMQRRQEELAARLKGLGVGQLEIETVMRLDQERCANPGVNLRIEIPGSTDRRLVIGTYVDAPAYGDGVVNNWSGCVMLAALYQAFREAQPRHTLILVAFGAESLGCWGAEAEVARLGKEALAQVDLMVSLQCFGLAEPGAWRQASGDAALVLAGSVAERMGLKWEVRRMAGDVSDAHKFRRRGVPLLYLDGMDPAQAGILNTEEDNLTVVRPDLLHRSYQFLVEFIQEADAFSQRFTWEAYEEALGLEVAAAQRERLKSSVLKVELGAAPEPPGDSPGERSSPTPEGGDRTP